MKDVFEFDKDAETGGVINTYLGRIYLHDGGIARIMLSPEGVYIIVPGESIGHSVQIAKGVSRSLGSLPPVMPPKEGCGRTDSDEKRKEHFRAEDRTGDEDGQDAE